MADFENVQLVAERREDQGMLEVLLDLDGARVLLTAVKLGTLTKAERLRDEAREAQESQADADRQAQERAEAENAATHTAQGSAPTQPAQG